jgi:salicylate hydroxylase
VSIKPSRFCLIYLQNRQSCSREAIGIKPLINKSLSCSFRCVISADNLRRLNLEDFLKDNAIQMWGGMGVEKVVIGPARGGEILCAFAFFSAEKSDLQHEGWDIPASPQTLLLTFPDLDPNL